MKKSLLNRLFRECLHRSYRETDDAVSWDFFRRGNTLYLYFEPSNGTRDWINNFTFHAVPYREMQPEWQCHAGFLKCWKSVKPHVEALISDATLSRVIIVGYSHGGALAVLCHEFVYFHRPDLQKSIYGFGFGCPRVLYGCLPEEIAERWRQFYVIRNADDLITHLPPRVLGYCHVGNLVTIGESEDYNSIDAHRPESYLRALR